jgi:hypothetical protein
MWAVMADEDHAARVLVDRVHNPEHARCLPPPSANRNRFSVTSVWERGLGSLTRSGGRTQRSCCAFMAAANPVSGHQTEVSILRNHDDEPT